MQPDAKNRSHDGAKRKPGSADNERLSQVQFIAPTPAGHAIDWYINHEPLILAELPESVRHLEVGKSEALKSMEHFQEAAKAGIEAVRTQGSERLEDFQARSTAYIRERPTASILAAIGIGFVLAKIFRR